MWKQGGNRKFRPAVRQKASMVPLILPAQGGDIDCREVPEDAEISNPIDAMSAKAQKAEKAEGRGQVCSLPEERTKKLEAARTDRDAAASRVAGCLESRRVRLSSGQLHFYAGGTDLPDVSPVVLVHGLVIASRYMLPTARYLVPFCPTYVVDLPGYGWSDKPRTTLSLPQLAGSLAEWLQTLSLRRAHLVANSFGCQILAHFAVTYPQYVDRLVFQGPTIDPEARTLTRQFVRLIRNSRTESPGLGLLMAKDYWNAGIRRIIATVTMALKDRIEERLPRIDAPTLVVRGERDPLVPQAWAETVARLLPHGQLRTIPGCGHTINYTAPGEFVDVMLPFLGV
jgi:2-hydroxy-6-oxonona-2,4-dienedioate hydrolase